MKKMLECSGMNSIKVSKYEPADYHWFIFFAVIASKNLAFLRKVPCHRFRLKWIWTEKNTMDLRIKSGNWKKAVSPGYYRLKNKKSRTTVRPQEIRSSKKK